MPNAYLLPQSHQEELADKLNSEDLINLESYHSPQGKSGSTTDTQQYAEPKCQMSGVKKPWKQQELLSEP